MDANRNYINENIVNISLMAGKLIADGKISVEDHAELTDHIVALAESFEASHKDIDYNAQVKAGEPAPDYVEDNGAFAEKALIEAYPPKEEVHWSFAETALGKFCLEEVPYRLSKEFDIDPDTLDPETIYKIAEKVFEVCIDGEAVCSCIEDFLNEHGISAEQECSNEALTEDTLKSDVGSIKPTLADQIQNAASQAGKGSQGSMPSLVQMPGTQAPDWGKKQWGNDR